MRSSQNPSQIPSDGKLWSSIIAKIDAVLVDFRVVFDTCFAESQTELKPRELIKRGLLRYIWEKLADDAPLFQSLDSLDAYYQNVALNFKRHVGDYLRFNYVKDICQQYQLADPVSERKLEMLKKIIHLYHALVRSRFLLRGLNDEYSIDKCADKVMSAHAQTQVNQELLSKIDVELYQKRSVNGLKSFNQYVLQLISEKGYGQISLDGLLVPDAEEKLKDSAFVALYAKLQELPTVSELTDLMDGKRFDSKIMREEKLGQHINTIQTIRLLLRKICNEVFIASSRNVETLATDYAALLEIKSKIKSDQDLDDFSRKLTALTDAIEGEVRLAPSFPTLRQSARDVIEAGGKQSQAEMITRIDINGWGMANSCVKDNVVDIIQSMRTVSRLYQDQIDQYHAVIEYSRQQKELFTKAERLIMEWRAVNQQMQQVLEQCDQLLGVVETKVVTESQTALHYAGSFLKHHWPKMVIGAAVVAVPAAAVSFTVFSAASAAIMIPAGFVAGSAGGVSVGIVADNKHPRPVSPPISRRPNVSVAGVNSDFIIDKLFSPSDVSVKPTPFILSKQEPSKIASPPSPILDEPTKSSVTVVAIPYDEIKVEKTEPEHKMPKWLANMAQLSSQLTDQLVQVPGHLAQVPGRLAQVPGHLAQVPGQLVQLPGQLAQMSGLFARPTQTVQESSSDTPAPEVVKQPK